MEILNSFKDYLKVRDYSLAYHNPVSIFLYFCQKQEYNYLTITLEQANDFLLDLKTQGHKNGYINNFINAIRFFYLKFLLKHNKCSDKTKSAIEQLQLLRTERVIKDYLTEEELGEVISMGESFCTQLPYYKLKALLNFMFYTGVRKEELLNFKRTDIDLINMKAIVRIPTKSKEEDYVFFTKEVQKDLEEYFRNEAEQTNAFNISTRQLSYLFQQLREFAPSGKVITPHTFRRSFAMMLAAKGIDIKVAQKLLRHKSMKSTEIYFDPDTRTVEKLYHERIGHGVSRTVHHS